MDRSPVWVRQGVLLAVLALGCASPPLAPPPPPPPPAAAAVPVPATPTADPSGDWDVRWDRTFAGWWPPVFEGRLSVQREGEGWAGRLHFKQSVVKLTVESLRINGDRVDIAFSTGVAADPRWELSGWLRDGRLIGEMRSDKIGWTPVGGRRTVPLPRLVQGVVDHALPRLDGAHVVDSAPARELLDQAREERSSAVVVVKDGKIVIEAYREGYAGSPIMAMSASKSIASLAVGMLIAEGKLSLDTRMGDLFPDWKKQGKKATITVRHLLTHTSGLDPTRADWSNKETIREHTLRAKLVFQPGSRFQYNNDAVDFLAVVFEKAAGIPLDKYLEARLFSKLDIVGATWMKDSEGTPRAAGELAIRPVDLAKIGQLLLDGGRWQGAQLVPADWIERSVAPAQPYNESCGMLWWREGKFSLTLDEAVLGTWRDLGVGDEALRSAHALLGRRFASTGAYTAAVKQAVGVGALEKISWASQHGDHVPYNGMVSDGPSRGFSARGWLGQYLVVLPQARVVGVRMRASTPEDHDGGAERDGYPGFADDVSRLF